LDGKVHTTGPLINELVEPPVMADVAVFVIVSLFEDVVVSIPFVSVKVPLTVVAAPKVPVCPDLSIISLL